MDTPKISRAAVYDAIYDAGEDGISITALCEHFCAERNVVHNYVGRLVHEIPPRAIRTVPGATGNVVAACYRGMPGAIQTAPVRKLGIVVGSTDHKILLALRAPGGMTTEQIYARFPGQPSSAISRLRTAGLIEDGEGSKEKQVSLTPRGRELVDPDGPLARRRTLNTYCQL